MVVLFAEIDGMSQAIGAILNEIHGLLHEAKSNVELDPAKGQRLIERVSVAESAHKSGTLQPTDLAGVIAELRDAIAAPIEKELSIDNPEAAVIQIGGLLKKLDA